MSDAIEAMKSDQPAHRDAEKDLWEIIKRWHNFMWDVGILNDSAKSLGKFSDDFGVNVTYAEMKPMETEKDRLELIEKGRDLKLITKRDALKKLHPNMTDEEIELKIEDIKSEMDEVRQQFGLGPFAPAQPGGQDGKES
jgi:hypothetical protein